LLLNDIFTREIEEDKSKVPIIIIDSDDDGEDELGDAKRETVPKNVPVLTQ